jgi:hypothetical protein
MAASGSVERSHGNVPVASVESQRWALPRTRHRHVEANFNSAAFRKRIAQRDALRVHSPLTALTGAVAL